LCKPSFVFLWFSPQTSGVSEMRSANGSNTSNSFNLESMLIPERSAIDTALGVSFAVSSALIWSIVIIIIRKMNIQGVHYSLSVIYSTYFAIPITLIGSLLFFLLENTKRNPVILESTSLLIWQFVYALIASVSGILQIVFFNLALKHEEAQKIAIIASTDLVFGFILQYFILDITSDIFGIIGSLLIIGSTLLIAVYKLLISNKTKSLKI
jgi:drug/metabolite transporter (DMT)-like permease